MKNRVALLALLLTFSLGALSSSDNNLAVLRQHGLTTSNDIDLATDAHVITVLRDLLKSEVDPQKIAARKQKDKLDWEKKQKELENKQKIADLNTKLQQVNALIQRCHLYEQDPSLNSRCEMGWETSFPAVVQQYSDEIKQLELADN